MNGVFRKGRASHSFFIAEVAPLELTAALYRKTRLTPPSISIAQVDSLVAWFRRELLREQYQIVKFSDEVLARAETLCRLYPLRAYDALQLASALIVADEARALKEPSPTFMCADNNLLTAAAGEKLATDNPLDHQ